MKFFLDTADTEEIRQGAALGLVDGVTTNPSLIAKTKRPFKELVAEIVQIVKGPISLETVSQDAAGMIREGKEFHAIDRNIVVKCPLTEEGLKATRALASEGVRVNVTLIFTPVQALLAAKAGAAYVSPFIGRLDDIGTDGMDIIKSISLIFKNYEFPTNILAASVRHPVHVLRCAEAGAHVATMPLKTLKQLFEHPLTKSGLEKFLADWENYQNTSH